MSDTKRRVKLYALNAARQWEDKGTGHVSSVYVERLKGISLIVREESDGSLLLESRIECDTTYQKQQDTLIVWTEGHTVDLALSFQEKAGCDEIWDKICSVQGKDSSLDYNGDGSSGSLTSGHGSSANCSNTAGNSAHEDGNSMKSGYDLCSSTNSNSAQSTNVSSMERRNTSIYNNNNNSESDEDEDEENEGVQGLHHSSTLGDASSQSNSVNFLSGSGSGLLGGGHGVLGGGTGGVNISHQTTFIELPSPPDMSRLEEISDMMTSCLPSPFRREKLASAIESEFYIEKLLNTFRMCEDIENIEGLHHLFEIFKTMFMLNKHALFEVMFSDSNIFDVIGCLEYDPTLDQPKRHREYLKSKAVFHEVVKFENSELLCKIHQTYRVQYIQDVVLPPQSVFDDNNLTTLASFIFFNKVEIVNTIQDNNQILNHLFQQLTNTSTSATTSFVRRNSILFLKELCNFSLQMHQPSRETFFKKLHSQGVLSALKHTISDEDLSTRIASIDVLTYIVEFSASAVRDFTLHSHHSKISTPSPLTPNKSMEGSDARGLSPLGGSMTKRGGMMVKDGGFFGLASSSPPSPSRPSDDYEDQEETDDTSITALVDNKEQHQEISVKQQIVVQRQQQNSIKASHLTPSTKSNSNSRKDNNKVKETAAVVADTEFFHVLINEMSRTYHTSALFNPRISIGISGISKSTTKNHRLTHSGSMKRKINNVVSLEDRQKDEKDRQRGDPSTSNFSSSSSIRRYITDPDLSGSYQIMTILRILLDPENMDLGGGGSGCLGGGGAFGGLGGGGLPNQMMSGFGGGVPGGSSGGSITQEKSVFLSYFYRHCMHLLITPLLTLSSKVNKMFKRRSSILNSKSDGASSSNENTPTTTTMRPNVTQRCFTLSQKWGVTSSDKVTSSSFTTPSVPIVQPHHSSSKKRKGTKGVSQQGNDHCHTFTKGDTNTPLHTHTSKGSILNELMSWQDVQLMSFILELLTFFVEHHKVHIKNYIIHKDLLRSVMVLTYSRHHFLVLGVVRLVRRIVSLRDEFYNRYMVKNNLFASIVEALLQNNARYNLLDSAILELFNFIQQENIKSLCIYIVEKFSLRLDVIDYVPTFRLLKHSLLQNNSSSCSMQNSLLRSSSTTPSPHLQQQTGIMGTGGIQNQHLSPSVGCSPSSNLVSSSSSSNSNLIPSSEDHGSECGLIRNREDLEDEFEEDEDGDSVGESDEEEVGDEDGIGDVRDRRGLSLSTDVNMHTDDNIPSCEKEKKGRDEDRVLGNEKSSSVHALHHFVQNRCKFEVNEKEESLKSKESLKSSSNSNDDLPVAVLVALATNHQCNGESTERLVGSNEKDTSRRNIRKDPRQLDSDEESYFNEDEDDSDSVDSVEYCEDKEGFFKNEKQKKQDNPTSPDNCGDKLCHLVDYEDDEEEEGAEGEEMGKEENPKKCFEISLNRPKKEDKSPSPKTPSSITNGP